MALRPDPPLSWDGHDYAGYGHAWEQAVEMCRGLLRDWARQGQIGTYTDVASRISDIPWENGPYTHQGRQMGYLLGQSSLDELTALEDRPVLSALVVSKEDNMPSAGFWGFIGELGIQLADTQDARVAFWSAEVRRCHDLFGT